MELALELQWKLKLDLVRAWEGTLEDAGRAQAFGWVLAINAFKGRCHVRSSVFVYAIAKEIGDSILRREPAFDVVVVVQCFHAWLAALEGIERKVSCWGDGSARRRCQGQRVFPLARRDIKPAAARYQLNDLASSRRVKN